MKKEAFCLAAILTAAPLAHAETASAPALDKRVTVSASGIVALPQADADDTTRTSLGVGTSATYWVNSYFGVAGSFDYIFANKKRAVVPDDYRIYFYTLNVGVRVAAPDRSGPQPFGHFSLGRHTWGYKGPLDNDSQSDLGIRLGGGVLYRTGAGVALLAQLTYSSAEIENADINGFLVDLGVAWDL
jgi:hypothetical protein